MVRITLKSKVMDGTMQNIHSAICLMVMQSTKMVTLQFGIVITQTEKKRSNSRSTSQLILTDLQFKNNEM